MKIWTEHPAKADIEAVVRHYFSLLRAGRIPDLQQLIDHHPVRHVLKALWTGSVEDNADENEVSPSPAADAWDQDLSWLNELHPAEFHWNDDGGGVYVEITYRAQIIEVALSFRVKPVEAGWVISGPATLW